MRSSSTCCFAWACLVRVGVGVRVRARVRAKARARASVRVKVRVGIGLGLLGRVAVAAPAESRAEELADALTSSASAASCTRHSSSHVPPRVASSWLSSSASRTASERFDGTDGGSGRPPPPRAAALEMRSPGACCSSGCEVEGRTPCRSSCRAVSSDAGSHGAANAVCGRLCPAVERPTSAAEEVLGRLAAAEAARSRCSCSWMSAPDGVSGGLVSCCASVVSGSRPSGGRGCSMPSDCSSRARNPCRLASHSADISERWTRLARGSASRMSSSPMLPGRSLAVEVERRGTADSVDDEALVLTARKVLCMAAMSAAVIDWQGQPRSNQPPPETRAFRLTAGEPY
eukprot:scaffold19927_cov65-Phaeocystis_antarctica.AAC.2